jgi:hypothetical protein
MWEFFNENTRECLITIAIGAIAMGLVDTYFGTPGLNRQRESTVAADQPPRPQFTSSPPPWRPGAPHNPQECIARGGIDMGRYCHNFH